jgi:hypothetical protein
MVVSEKAQMTRGRLFEALSSPSGKLTLSPEIIIPEPSEITAILLQSSAITSMSEKIRVQAKANSAWISGSVTSLKTFCNEQEQARGTFPGPVPTIYCDKAGDLSAVAAAGAEGVLVSVCDGNEVDSLDRLAEDSAWVEACKAALECGLQPIPEVTIGDSTAASWKEVDIEALVAKISELSGAEPVSLLITINPVDEEQEEVSLPAVPKALSKRVPIMGSVRVAAGENRIGIETARFKAAGFTGAVLRSDCMPGLKMNLDLEYVGKFWSACIGDLKSLKSKSFNFQTKNFMNKSAPFEWAKYQKDVIESGSLGEMSDNIGDPGVNTDNGDYQGF